MKQHRTEIKKNRITTKGNKYTENKYRKHIIKQKRHETNRTDIEKEQAQEQQNANKKAERNKERKNERKTNRNTERRTQRKI